MTPDPKPNTTPTNPVPSPVEVSFTEYIAKKFRLASVLIEMDASKRHQFASYFKQERKKREREKRAIMSEGRGTQQRKLDKLRRDK